MGGGSGGSGSGGRSGGGGDLDTRDLRSKGANIGTAIELMRENLASGRLDRMVAYEAFKSLLDQEKQYEAAGEYGKAKVARIRATALNKAAGFLK